MPEKKEKSQAVQLEKFITGELQTLSPLEELSIELKEKAEAVKISNGYTYTNAKAIRRELVTHRTTVKDMRLTFTRKLDNLKDQFIKKQDLVLQPSIAGEALIKEKILIYEADVQRRKDVELARIAAILARFEFEKPLRASVTLEEIHRLRAWVKMELGLLDSKDRNKVAIKDKVAEIRVYLRELGEFVIERDRQAKEAEALHAERARLDAERAELAAEKAKAVDKEEVSKGIVVTDTVFSPKDIQEVAENAMTAKKPVSELNDERGYKDIPRAEEDTLKSSLASEIDRLADYLLAEWPLEITDGSAVDVAIKIMNKFKETK